MITSISNPYISKEKKNFYSIPWERKSLKKEFYPLILATPDISEGVEWLIWLAIWKEKSVAHRVNSFWPWGHPAPVLCELFHTPVDVTSEQKKAGKCNLGAKKNT